MFETMAVEIEQLLGKVIHKLLCFYINVLKYYSTGFCEECLESNSMGDREAFLKVCIWYKGKLLHLIYLYISNKNKPFQVGFVSVLVFFLPLQLTGINDKMAEYTNSAGVPSLNAALMHTLQRHRDILQVTSTCSSCCVLFLWGSY